MDLSVFRKALSTSPFGKDKVNLKDKKLTLVEKTWLGQQVNKKILTATWLASFYGLSAKTLRTYGLTIRRGSTTRENGGRPPILSTESKEKLCLKLTEGPYRVKTVDFKDMVHQLAKEEAISNDKGMSTVPTISRRTLRRIEKDLDIQTGNAETTTDARAMAVTDLRNGVSFAALNVAIGPYVCQQLHINIDGTIYTVGGSGSENKEVKYIGKRNGSLKVQPEKQSGGISQYSIKFMMLICAGGHQGPPIYIIADDKMNEEELDLYKVPGMGIGNAVGDCGYIVFCKSRCCNMNFFVWLNTEILIPWIYEIKKIYNLADDALTFLQLDGEPVQIKCYEAASMQTSMAENNVVVGKGPASCTEIYQACDAGTIFISSKAVLKKIKDKDVGGDKFTAKKERLKNIFYRHNT